MTKSSQVQYYCASSIWVMSHGLMTSIMGIEYIFLATSFNIESTCTKVNRWIVSYYAFISLKSTFQTCIS